MSSRSLVQNLGLDLIDGVASLHVQSDGLANPTLDEDLHGQTRWNPWHRPLPRVLVCHCRLNGRAEICLGIIGSVVEVNFGGRVDGSNLAGNVGGNPIVNFPC